MCAKREMPGAGNLRTKRLRKSLSLGDKLDVLKRYDAGQKGIQISRELGLAPTTVKTIRDNKEKIIASAQSATSLSALIVNRSRSATMEKMEQQLFHWIEDQQNENHQLSMILIQERARAIFKELKSTQEDNTAPDTFSASSGWFDRFKRRFNMTLNTSSVATKNADFEAADNFVNHIRQLIEEEDYTYQQIFNIDEISLQWKRVPYKGLIPKDDESTAISNKAAKEKLTVLIGGNAEGDCKIKPVVVYHTENPMALEDYNKIDLRVSWYANRNGKISGTVFTDWFFNHAIPFWKEYCLKQELPFKILLIIDNAPNYPTNLDDLHPTVKIIRLPPNTITLLQPMKQGAMATFKTFYYRRIFAFLTKETEAEGKPSIAEFWQNFNIYNGINIIADSWDELSRLCMNGVWRKLIPDCVHDNMDIPQVECDIVTLNKQIDFEKEDSQLDNQTDECPEATRQMESALEQKPEEIETPAQLSTVTLTEYLKMIDKAQDFIKEHDPNGYRSASVSRMVFQAVNPYKELCDANKKNTLKKKRNKLKKQKLTKVKRTKKTSSENVSILQ